MSQENSSVNSTNNRNNNNNNNNNNHIDCKELAFARPNSFSDGQWKWRELLQSRKLQTTSQEHILSKFDTSQNQWLLHKLSKHWLKFACPKHDLMYSLSQNGFGMEKNMDKYVICNGYSPDCNQQHNNNNNNNNQFVELRKWSFHDLRVECPKITHVTPTKALEIKFSINSNGSNVNSNTNSNTNTNTNTNTNSLNNNNNNESKILFDILRTNEDAFIKRFRPGLYKYNGEVRRQVPAKEAGSEPYRWSQKENQLGTWFQGKLFYARKNDLLLISIIENVFYLKFTIDSHLIKKKRDGLTDIVGGIGISMLHRNKNEFGALRNCILLRCSNQQLQNCLKNSYVVAYCVKNSNYQNLLKNGIFYLSAFYFVAWCFFLFFLIFLCFYLIFWAVPCSCVMCGVLQCLPIIL